MSDGLTREEVLEKIDASVEDLLTAAGWTEPPVDAIALAQRHLGMIVCLDRRQQQRGRAQRAAGRKQIFLRPEPTEERHQWTVAHEIGEHLKVALLQRLSVDPEATGVMAGETLANLFASRLLAPTCWYAHDARSTGWDLLRLKQRYRTVSHEVLAMRLLDLGEPCAITVVDNGTVTKRRGNTWTPGELMPAELECQRSVHEQSKPTVVREDGWVVQGWPVHSSEWKREILRSVRDGME